MKVENISDLISELVQSLSISATGYVDWHQFLENLARYCGAESAILKCTIRENVHYMKEGGSNECVNLCTIFRLGHEDSYVGLSFYSIEQYEYAANCLNQIKDQIREVYKLGMLWQEQHKMQGVADSFTSMKRMASVDIDEQGRIQKQGGIFTELLETGALQLKKGCLQFSADTSWLLSVQKDMMIGKNENQTAFRFVYSADKNYRCVVSYAQNIDEGWRRIKHKFTISFYESIEKKDPETLAELFSLSKSEAEVAVLFSQGFSAEEVSRDTGLAVSTVYSYIKNLYAELGINKQSQLTAVIWPELPVAVMS